MVIWEVKEVFARIGWPNIWSTPQSFIINTIQSSMEWLCRNTCDPCNTLNWQKSSMWNWGQNLPQDDQHFLSMLALFFSSLDPTSQQNKWSKEKEEDRTHFLLSWGCGVSVMYCFLNTFFCLMLRVLLMCSGGSCVQPFLTNWRK